MEAPWAAIIPGLSLAPMLTPLTKFLLKKCDVFKCAVCHLIQLVSTFASYSLGRSKQLSVFVTHYVVKNNIDKNSLVNCMQKNISKAIHVSILTLDLCAMNNGNCLCMKTSGLPLQIKLSKGTAWFIGASLSKPHTGQTAFPAMFICIYLCLYIYIYIYIYFCSPGS